MPSMLLQPLIENSIKHGLSSKVDGGIFVYGVAWPTDGCVSLLKTTASASRKASSRLCSNQGLA